MVAAALPLPGLLAARSSAHHGTAASARFLTLDALRGFAVLGILFRNIFIFAIPTSAYTVPTIWGADTLANQLSYGFVEIFADGSMRALFTILFGASALLLLGWNKTDRVGDPGKIDRYYRRLICLIAFGLLNAYIFLWPFDVIFLYGLLGLLIFPLRNLGPKTLISVALSAMLVLGVASGLELETSGHSAQSAGLETIEIIPPAGNTDTGQAAETVITKSEPVIQEGSDAAKRTIVSKSEALIEQDAVEAFLAEWQPETDARLAKFWDNFFYSAEITFLQHTEQLIKLHLIDIGAMLLFGMALFKLGVLTGERSTRFYFLLMIGGYLTGLLFKLPRVDVITVEALLPAWNMDWGILVYDFARGGIALGHIGAIVLLCRAQVFSRLMNVFASSGRLTLTLYLSQSVVCAWLFYGFGLGWYSSFEHGQLVALAALLGLAQLILAHVYLRSMQRGPFEWLLKRAVEGIGPRHAPA